MHTIPIMPKSEGMWTLSPSGTHTGSSTMYTPDAAALISARISPVISENSSVVSAVGIAFDAPCDPAEDPWAPDTVLAAAEDEPPPRAESTTSDMPTSETKTVTSFRRVSFSPSRIREKRSVQTPVEAERIIVDDTEVRSSEKKYV